MTHLRIEQNNNVEVLGTGENNVGIRIIEFLYNLAKSGLDSNSLLRGTLSVSKAYRTSVEYLQQNTDLQFIVQDYIVKFDDPVFEQVCSQVIGSSGYVTETQAALATKANADTILVDCSGTRVNNIDFSPFTNVEDVRLSNDINYQLSNVYLETLNLGNVSDLTPDDSLSLDPYMNLNFNMRFVYGNVIAETFVAENLKFIGVFALRGLGFNEAYFPNVEYIGGGIGNIQDTLTIQGESKTYARKFIFIGDKIKAFNELSESNSEQFGGICVITATTPPVINAGWESRSRASEYTIGTAGDQTYKWASYHYYVPDSALEDYKTDPLWQPHYQRWGDDWLKPISELPDQYKQKISKYYTIN